MDLTPLPKRAKRAVSVAEAIEDRIAEAGWKTGAYIDDEVTLREQHAVGRSVFRQAIRVLEHLGVVTMRRGRGGGLVVSSPTNTPSSLALRIGWSKSGSESFEINRLVDGVRVWSRDGSVDRLIIANAVAAAATVDDEPLKLSSTLRPKAGERLAGEMLEEMAGQGWSSGTLLGSENDLMQSYRVGRESLREAVQLLEFHDVARMQRGPGGGLLVESVPSGSALAASLRVQLGASGTPPEQISLIAKDLLDALTDPRTVFGVSPASNELKLAARELTDQNNQPFETPLAHAH